ncbi:MAG: SIR2 family protein [Cellvibrio sp.]|uniref:SIR2 family protein n=1 Tax=Cellvibrio sp. TaxID=1965322 RepID=UPI00271CDB3D|nr:SIR2 family protein [Cellvibrio sp.]
MAKFTTKDIKLLAKQMRASYKDEKPFTLLTGAGCSVSAGIPLAGTLVKEILKTYGDECRRQLDDEQLRDYGACMSCVPINARRKLFSDHLKKAKINWAHIAIACLMKAGYVGRVITFNFDSILARACSLLGMYPPTYDFAAAATVDTDYIAPQAIIHLHGQGTGKHLLNSDKETHNHAENIRPLIRATFTESSLLVIGYSGSSDAVFPVLTQEYSGRENLWWAGYESNPNLNIEGLIRPYSGVA